MTGPHLGAIVDRATVATVTPLTVATSAAATAVPAILPMSPAVTVAVGARVLVVFNEGELVVIGRLS